MPFESGKVGLVGSNESSPIPLRMILRNRCTLSIKIYDYLQIIFVRMHTYNQEKMALISFHVQFIFVFFVLLEKAIKYNHS